MIKISRLADYATILMTHIARNPQQVYSAQCLADNSKIHLPTVSKLLKRLTQAKLLLSQRGSQGGYQLAKENKLISLADIISAIDGNIALTECVSDHHCDIESFCTLTGNWKIISHVIHHSLSHVTLLDMTNPLFSKKLKKTLKDATPITWSH